MKKLAVRFDRVYSNINGVEIIRQLNLRVYEGEIFGVININYLGQDMFIDLLRRNIPIHYGRIYIGGNLVNHYETSNGSVNNEVAIFNRNTKLIDGFNASENFRVFSKIPSSYIINEKDNLSEFNKYMNLLDVSIDGRTLVENLSLYERYIIEIARELALGTTIFVFRDVSNFIAQSDVASFYKILNLLKNMNKTVFYVGNHHEELFEICDRVSLWEDGTIVKILKPRDYNGETMKRYSFKHSLVKIKDNIDHPVTLKMENVYYKTLQKFSVDAKKGECITILDKENVIFDDLMDLFLNRSTQNLGNVSIDGFGLKESYNNIIYLPQYPIDNILIDGLTLEDNIFIMLKKKYPNLWFNKKFRKEKLMQYSNILTTDLLNQYPKDASTVDLYHCLYYSILINEPKVVFLSQPFASADMYLRLNIINLINKLKEKNITVIILAVSFSDTQYVSNRIFSVYEGKVIESK